MDALEKLFGIVDKFNNAIGPGVTPVKQVLNRPGMASNLKAFGKGLAGTPVSKGNLLEAALGATQTALINSNTPYGNKVKAAVAEDEANVDALLKGGMSGLITDAFKPAAKSGMPNLDPNYAREEQDMINAAQLFRGQQNRAAQLDAGEIYGSLPDDYKQTEAKEFKKALDAGDPQPQFIQDIASSGLDTKTAKREAPPKELSEGMAAWAKANPELANKLIDKVQDRRQTNPDYQQSGYDTIFATMRPEEAAAAKTQGMNDFSANDAAVMGMSTQDAADIASGGFVETLIDGDTATSLLSSPDSPEKSAQDLANDRIAAVIKARSR